MAEKKPMIVVKKITINAAGHHGGSWKVAFADFMTAMMAFFLVMWLVNQSEEVKKSVADYFSTPSVIEYNFSNYGVELTLEKLFLDLVNEPLKAFEQFIRPVDKTPNVMDLGMKKIQQAFLTNKLGEFGASVNVLSDEITFEIPASYLFVQGSARPADQFVNIMERVREVVQGVKDVDIFINAEQPFRRGENEGRARALAEARLDFISQKVEASVERENVDIFGKTTVEAVSPVERRKDFQGTIKFRLKQKFDDKTLEKTLDKTPSDGSTSGPTDGKNRSVQNAVPPAPQEPDVPKVHDPSEAFNSVVDRVSGQSPEVQ
jgi:chemotaxis protein MotB